jgi:branched-chain amino acid transport system permease protein
MTTFLQAVAVGLGNGSVYALLALGFVIIYKSTLVISFAQPGLMVIGALWVVHLGNVIGINWYLSVLLAVMLTAALGLVAERVALRPLVGKPVFVAAIVTIGLDIILRVIANRYIGPDIRSVNDPWGLSTASIAGIVVQHRHLAMFVTTAFVVAGLFLFFKYSRIGLAMRATAFDQETALAQGISVGAVFALSWAIAGGLAAIAGTFVGTGSGIDQGTWVIALKALPAIILGGLDSVEGAVVGGLIVGVTEALFGTYQATYLPWLGNNFAIVSPYVLMLAILLVRPYGLFGTREVERV